MADVVDHRVQADRGSDFDRDAGSDPRAMFVRLDEFGRVYLRVEDTDRLKRIEDKLDELAYWALQTEKKLDELLKRSPSPPLP